MMNAPFLLYHAQTHIEAMEEDASHPYSVIMGRSNRMPAW